MKTWRILEKRVTWILAALSIPLAPAIVVLAVHVPLDAEAGKTRSPAETSAPGADGIDDMIALLESVPDPWWLTFSRGHEPRIWGAPELSPVINCMAEKLLPVAERFRETAAREPLDPARIDERMIATAGSRKRMPVILVSARAAYMSQMVLSAGWAELADGNPDGAMARAVESVALFRPMARRAPYLMLERGWHSLALFETVLWENPDTTVSKQALQHLHKLDFQLNTELLGADIYFVQSKVSAGTGQDLSPLQIGQLTTWGFLTDAASALSLESSLMIRPENKRWAERLRQTDGSSFNSYAGIFTFLPWTRIPALESHLRHVVESEPKLRWRQNAVQVLAAGVDPFKAAVHTYRSAFELGQGVGTWLRPLLTSRNALMAGFAARIHQAETGQWPSSMQVLASAYGNLPLPSAPGALPIEQIPLGTVEPYPLRIERAAISDGLIEGMLQRGRSLPKVSLTELRVPSTLAPEDGSVVYEGRAEWSHDGYVHALTAFEDIDSWKASLGNRLKEATVFLETDQTSRTITRKEAVDSALRGFAIPDDLCGLAPERRREPGQDNAVGRVVITFRLEIPRTLFTIKYGSHALALVQGDL